MLTQKNLDRICELANQVEDKLQDLDTETLTGLLDAVNDWREKNGYPRI